MGCGASKALSASHPVPKQPVEQRPAPPGKPLEDWDVEVRTAALLSPAGRFMRECIYNFKLCFVLCRRSPTGFRSCPTTCKHMPRARGWRATTAACSQLSGALRQACCTATFAVVPALGVRDFMRSTTATCCRPCLFCSLCCPALPLPVNERRYPLYLRPFSPLTVSGPSRRA